MTRRRILTPEALQAYKEKHALTNTQIGTMLGYAVQEAPYWNCRTVTRMLAGEWTGNWDKIDRILASYNLQK